MGEISPQLADNEAWVDQTFEKCDDILHRQVYLGQGRQEGLLVYVEVAVSNLMLEEHVIGLSDVQPLKSYEEGKAALLAGNGLLFLDGDTNCYKISSEKINVALIRKRLRDSRMKVEEQTVGVRSHTMTALVYMEDLIYQGLLTTMKQQLQRYEIDGILDSGMLEQLSEKHWLSPFPQFQTTERPDRAAAAVLEGRIVLVTDHSPQVLILPSDYNSFFQTSDDWYNRFQVASYARTLRFFAAILSMIFPAVYVAVATWHTSLLPTKLVLSMAEARQGVPFPALGEILLMEISFELLKEAGIRLPGPMGNTIGIVGGLIIGQAAVDASLVSPIVVIVVAFTALCSFAIPNEEFASAFRILKYGCIFMGAWLGLYGVALSGLWVLIHLSHLNSFGIPYLMPYVAADVNGYEDKKDSLFRFPLKYCVRRPIFARRGERIKLRKRD